MLRRLLLLTFFFAGVARAEPPNIDMARAGYPLEISRFAHALDYSRMIGYYLGGGAANFHKAEPRFADEGTWGLDYTGWHFRRRVALGWWHGRRYQGGPGAYQTDGPKLEAE